MSDQPTTEKGHVQVVARHRRNGKTTEAVAWVLAGEATDSYPFWTRVLLVPTIEAADNARKQFPALDYRQVFAWSEWRRARLGALPVEVAVDNADLLIAQTIGQIARLVTLTGEMSLPPAPEPEYVDCTCGHPNDDHQFGECPFPGCGCGALYEDECQHEWELRSEHDLWVCAWCSAEVTSPPAGGAS